METNTKFIPNISNLKDSDGILFTPQTSFSGWTVQSRIPWTEVFEESYNDDGELLLTSKKTYKHEDDPDLKPFTYKYVVNAIDLYKRTGDPGYAMVDVRLYLVPEPKYWTGEALKSIASLYGMENKTDEELHNNFQVTDAISNGMAVEMGKDAVWYDLEKNDEGFYDVLECPGVTALLDGAASVLDEVDGMRGFHIDAEWNALGSTGWDTLRYVLGGEDPVQKAIRNLFGKKVIVRIMGENYE